MIFLMGMIFIFDQWKPAIKCYPKVTTLSSVEKTTEDICWQNVVEYMYLCAASHLPGLNLSLWHHTLSRCILSSSCTRKAEAILEFHSHLSPLADPSGQWGPGYQALPYLLSFLLYQLVHGVQSFPGCPGHLWLRHIHHGQVPQGNPACHAYRGCHLSLVFHRNTVKEAVKETEKKKGKTCHIFRFKFQLKLSFRTFLQWKILPLSSVTKLWTVLSLSRFDE